MLIGMLIGKKAITISGCLVCGLLLKEVFLEILLLVAAPHELMNVISSQFLSYDLALLMPL